MNSITELSIDQLLIDIHPQTGKVIQWSAKKVQSRKMAEVFYRISKIDPDFRHRALKMSECSTWLEFKHFVETGEKTLNRANFCRQRICPMCDWRRSLKIFGQTSQIMDVLQSQGKRFLFATMSTKNCPSGQMKNAIDELNKGFSNLIRRKAFKNIVSGTMKSLEVTHNLKKGDPAYNTYNFHIHAIFAVDPSYFKRNYIKQSEWLKWWQESVGVDYEPHFNVKAVKIGDKGSIREVSKYATKPAEILASDPEFIESTVWNIRDALENRNLVAYTGCMRKIKAELNLEDAENGDLVNVDGEQSLNPGLEFILESYSWHVGFNWYSKK